MSKLKEVEINNIVNDLPAEDARAFIENNERVFKLPNIIYSAPNPLIDIEISLRRCERVGFFQE